MSNKYTSVYDWLKYIKANVVGINLRELRIMNYVVRIRNLREDNDLTQQEVATVLGTSQTMYARYERGANELPIRHLIVLAKYYDVSTDYLLGLTNKKSKFPREK